MNTSWLDQDKHGKIEAILINNDKWTDVDSFTIVSEAGAMWFEARVGAGLIRGLVQYLAAVRYRR